MIFMNSFIIHAGLISVKFGRLAMPIYKKHVLWRIKLEIHTVWMYYIV